MELIHYLVDIFLHLDTHLNDLALSLGPLLYVLLFLIIFAETGLVVTPFLPGDSLLFAIGALAAIDGSPIHVGFAVVLLAIAAVLGDAVNYAHRLPASAHGCSPARPRACSTRSTWCAPSASTRSYGGKTIILARFMPIVRTFAPFVAGIGRMRYAQFAAYNVVGGVVWVAAFTLAGYFFGNVPVVKRNFHFVIVAIIIISVIPPVLEFLRARREPRPIARLRRCAD